MARKPFINDIAPHNRVRSIKLALGEINLGDPESARLAHSKGNGVFFSPFNMEPASDLPEAGACDYEEADESREGQRRPANGIQTAFRSTADVFPSLPCSSWYVML